MNELKRFKTLHLSPRVVLRPGDHMRVLAGPYFNLSNGTRTSMAERGKGYTFLRYCKLGDNRWVEAQGPDGFVALRLSDGGTHPDLPGYVLRPYRLKRIKPAKKS